jgi:hypothetical protein
MVELLAPASRNRHCVEGHLAAFRTLHSLTFVTTFPALDGADHCPKAGTIGT